MKKFLTSILVIVLLALTTTQIKAQTEYEVGFESINPGNPLFYVKRIFEKIQVRFNDSPEFKYKLLDRRHKELVFLANEDRKSQMEQATNRYMTQIGLIIDNDAILKDKSEMMKAYVSNLEKARDIYESNSAYWLFLQQSSELTAKLVTSSELQ